MSSPPRKKSKNEEDVMPPDGVIQFEVDNVYVLDEEYRFSPEIVVKGVPWRVGVKYDGDLTVRLLCMSTQSTKWNIDVDAEFTLIHSYKSDKSFTVKDSYTFHTPCESWCGTSTNGFMEDDEGFIKDDKISIEVCFWITNMRGVRSVPHINFYDPGEPRHDVALVIEGERIYVSKQILAAHSDVFNVMFYGEFAEKNKKEIELENVDREEFHEMLCVIYPSCKNITDASAEYLLKIGDQFQMAYVIDLVETFLIASDDFSNTEKLKIADRFRLFGLQEHCLSQLKTKHDFKGIKDSLMYGDLSRETKDLLFERLLETHK